jgi:hypothetical protein
MSEEDLFEDLTAKPVIDPEKNYFEEYVGEGKKYRDDQAAGRALVEKDHFIEQLKKENEEARQELRSRITVEEQLTKLQDESREHQNLLDEKARQALGDGTGAGETSGSSIEQLDKLVEDKLRARDESQLAEQNKQVIQANLDAVQLKLQEAYGPNFAEEVKKIAGNLGVSTQFLTETGAKEPKALYAMLNLQANKDYRDITDPTPPTSVLNTSGMNNSFGGGERNEAYYDKLRKVSPDQFWTQATQVQRHKDALRLGAEFFA